MNTAKFTNMLFNNVPRNRCLCVFQIIICRSCPAARIPKGSEQCLRLLERRWVQEHHGERPFRAERGCVR